MKKRLRKMMMSLLITLVVLSAAGFLYLQHPKFGRLPEGANLERISRSPHYQNGAFQNLEPIPQTKNKRGAVAGLINYLMTKKERPVPPVPIPTIRTDLKTLDIKQDIVIWLGHSSYFIQLKGKRLLVDPVFSANASPVPHTNLAFEGTLLYKAEDLPPIDYLLMSHDHWDHLDYPTMKALQDKIGEIITGLGVGSHLERWGFKPEQIHELDWNDAYQIDESFSIHFLPMRHFSGRLFNRNKTLWGGFALITPARKLMLGGDSGYGKHFKEIGGRFGGFDFVALDSGQYNDDWPYVHMTPEEASQAAQDLNAKTLMPAHAGKFTLSYHAWDDPFIRSLKASQDKPYRFVTPMVGEVIHLDDNHQKFRHWWEEMASLKVF